jgi:hypothetical protein
MSFNENSVMQEQPAGESEVQSVRAPIVSVMQQSNTEPTTPSLPAGATALAWWDDMKYYWRQNASGNGCHLAPQDSYIDDVLTEGDFEIEKASKQFSSKKSTEAEQAARIVELVRELGQELRGFDDSGVEADAFVRYFRSRAIIARKIAGASAVSANHRLQHAAATTGDIDSVKETDFYKSDLSNCEKWARNDCLYEIICSQMQPEYPEVIKEFASQLASGVRSGLYDDAVEKGNKLKRPTPSPQASEKKLTAEELRVMRA